MHTRGVATGDLHIRQLNFKTNQFKPKFSRRFFKDSMNFNTTVFCTYLIRSIYQSSLLLKVRDSNPSGIVGQNISFLWHFNNFAFFISIQPTIIIRIFLLINLDRLVIPIWPETVEIFLLDSFWIIFLKSVNNRKLTSFSYFATLRTNVSDRKLKFDLKFLGIELTTDILTPTLSA